jgi:hypothetical protein
VGHAWPEAKCSFFRSACFTTFASFVWFMHFLYVTLQDSPDGLLRQSATVADSVAFQFAGGASGLVPGAYVEFAERHPLPQYVHLRVRHLYSLALICGRAWWRHHFSVVRSLLGRFANCAL